MAGQVRYYLDQFNPDEACLLILRGAGDDTDGVLNLVAGQPEFLGHRVGRLSCPEQVDHVIDTGAPRTNLGRPNA